MASNIKLTFHKQFWSDKLGFLIKKRSERKSAYVTLSFIQFRLISNYLTTWIQNPNLLEPSDVPYFQKQENWTSTFLKA